MADSSPELEVICCRDLCRHLSAPLMRGTFTKSAFISTDWDWDLSAFYFSPRLEDAVMFFRTFGWSYHLYGPDFDPSDEYCFDPYVVVEFCLKCLRHISTLTQPLQREDAGKVQAHLAETTLYVTYHEALARANELRETAYRRLEQALKAIRRFLGLLVGRSLQAESLNQAGDGDWACQLDLSTIGLDGALLVLEVENNRDQRWKICQDDFRGLFDSPPTGLAELVYPQAGVHDREDDRRYWPQYVVALTPTHDVLAEWDETQKLLRLSGTFSVTHNMKFGDSDRLEKYPLDKRTKKLLRHADFATV
ncbi:hypothetical protein QBC43DRAFT_366226 [Cladorrhinum sp. PSN259]|nr:hypothetical protein QBC43DRAFT_366226 [Cladorrhinum sp. PSN259]